MNARLGSRAARFDTAPKCIHQVDYVCRLGPLWPLNRLALLLLFQQLLE